MKLKFKLLILLLAMATSGVQAGEYSKGIHKGFVESAIETLRISNKYGTVKINDLGGDSITVDVLITVESPSENKAQYLFEQIEIEIRKSGSELSFETEIKENFKTKQHFTIDYMVNIPADRNLNITNKFGNVDVNSLNAKGIFEIHYGYIHAGEMIAPEGNPIRLNLAYSKADLEAFNKMVCETRYSKLYIGEAGEFRAESKYSTINAEELSSLILESKYDGINIEELDELRATSKYTNYNIEELSKSLVLDTEYGSVRIDEVGDELELIDLTNSYGGIYIGMDDLSYNINADCDYCNVKVAEGSFTGNRDKDGHRLQLNGTVGGSEPKATVRINSRYGGVKLSD